MKIGLLLYPHCMPAGLLAFADLLHAANRRAGQELFRTVFVALEAGVVNCANGVSLAASECVDRACLDALLVPSFWAESAQQVSDTLSANQRLIRVLARAQSMDIWSYCTGVCLLAASGRIQGRAATVTWWLVESMTRQFAGVHWQSERICVFDGAFATASGVNGYLPIARELIQRQLSTEVFHDLNKLMVLPRPVQPHKAFQSINLIEQGSPLLRRLHLWVEQAPAQLATVARLAEALGLSQRTLARRVASEKGLSIAAHVRCIKLNQVSERLMFTSSPVSAISLQLGFSSDSNMSRMFKSLTALSPLEYRQQYGVSDAASGSLADGASGPPV